MTWSQLQVGGHNRMGTHTIRQRDIKVALPPHLTDDRQVLAFSFGQGVQRVIGYRDDDTFFIVWFDPQGVVYKH